MNEISKTQKEYNSSIHKFPKLLYLLCILLSSCNQTKESQQEESLSRQNSIKSTPKKVSTITFDKIKDRFLHRNLEKAVFQDYDENSSFYWVLVQEQDSTKKHFIYEKELEELGFLELEKYQDKFIKIRRKFLYSINEFADGYLVGLAQGIELYTFIDYIYCDKQGKPIHFLFTIATGGDMGHRGHDFAFFSQDVLEVHNLNCSGQDCDYKKYSLKLTDNKQKIVTDTLEKIQTRYGDLPANLEKVDRYLFSEILKKYDLWKEHWGL